MVLPLYMKLTSNKESSVFFCVAEGLSLSLSLSHTPWTPIAVGDDSSTMH